MALLLKKNYIFETKYYSKPKIRKIMTEKISIIKRIIDSFCLIHNELEFKSITPHPKLQRKKIVLL